MRLPRNLSQLIILAFLLFPLLARAAEPIAPLIGPPLGERWFSITFGDKRSGFTHTTISAHSGGYEVISDSSARMAGLGFTRDAFSRETYQVNRDLSLKSFIVEQSIDGKLMRAQGEITKKGVKVTVESGGHRREKSLQTRNKVYPPPLLNFYPMMQGIRAGKKYRLQMLDIEEIKLQEVTITALGKETLAGGEAAVHLRNDLYPFVDNDIWLDLAGNTIRESVRDGLIVTRAEEGPVAGKFIIEAAIARKEWLLDFSLVRVDRPIARPAELKGMTVELSGIPDAMPLFSEGGQKAERSAGGRVLFTVSGSPSPPASGPSAGGAPEQGKSQLSVGESTTTDKGELLALKNAILGEEKDPVTGVERLVRWIAATVTDSAADDLSPLETVRLKKGNGQSRVRLYAALSRVAGIPTRAVAGLTYVAGKGFLYHSWAESLVGDWLAVDPGSGQVPADATHIKLAEGDPPDELAAHAGMVGRVQAKLVAEKY
jgi:hypothetical protein